MKTDMSPKAVTERLRLTSELRRLCLALGKARPVGGRAPYKRPKNAKQDNVNRP